MPAGPFASPKGSVHRGLEAPIEPPGRGELGRARAYAGVISSEIRRAERRGFHDRRTIDRSAQDIGQELHRDVARGHAAIDAEHGAGRHRPVGVHRFKQVAGLIADRLQRRLGDLGGARIARQAQQRAARIGIPIGCAQADERRHQIDLLEPDRPVAPAR